MKYNYMTIDYSQFKKEVNSAIAKLEKRGKKVMAKKWSKQSPYQKARYKPEYVFPEVWLYPHVGGMGIVINAEEYNTSTKIIDYLANII